MPIILPPTASSAVTATPTLAQAAVANPASQAKPYSDIISSVLLFGSAPFAALALAVAIIFNVTEPKPIQQKGLAKTAGTPHKKSNSEE